MDNEQAPDVVLIGPEWPERALLRAQFIEEGYTVVAIDAWPIPRTYRKAGMKPRVLIVDLQGLPDPRTTLDEVRFLIPSTRVLVVTAMGTLAANEVRRLGFTVIARPATIGEIVRAAVLMLSPTSTRLGLAPSDPASGLHDTHVEALNMRKQDRIASQQQSRPQQPQPTEKQQPSTEKHETQSPSETRRHEQVKGGGPHDQPTRPPRQPGKLPLPD
jgi:hypothetical protein